MKRSKAVEIIRDILTGFDSEIDSKSELADFILRSLEQVGMHCEYWAGDSFHGAIVKGFEPEGNYKKGDKISIFGGVFTIPEDGNYIVTPNSITRLFK